MHRSSPRNCILIGRSPLITPPSLGDRPIIAFGRVIASHNYFS
ncbi:MAG: hypothetical protein ACFE0J_25835 [Elainellaceae cyanobacterium]